MGVGGGMPWGGLQHLGAAGVSGAETIEGCDVVIGLVDGQRQLLFLEKLSGPLIAIQRSGKIIHTDQADGHVAERHRQAFGILKGQELLIGALIVRQRLLETVLAMEDIADVVLEARQPPPLPHARKNCPRLFGKSNGAIVFSQQDEGLERCAQRAGFFWLVVQSLKDAERSVVKRN